MFDTDIIIGAQVENGTSGLCSDIPTGYSQKVALRENPNFFKLDTKGDTTEHVIKLYKNVYWQKQAGRVW